MKYFLLLLFLVALGLLAVNVFFVDFSNPFSENSLVALISICAVLCAMLLLSICAVLCAMLLLALLYVSRKVAERRHKIQN